jgi:DNA repair exonuclease SbcCD ATPase subunit
MSGGYRRYQQSPSHNSRATSRTPDLYSFNNSGDMSGCYANNNESQVKIHELTNEKSELKESLEFLECERQVLIDSARELKETLQKERSQWKKETEELKKHLTESIAARVKAESQLTQRDVGANDAQLQLKRLTEELQSKDKQIELLRGSLDTAVLEIKELTALNLELKRMLREKIKFNGFNGANKPDEANNDSDCISMLTEMARLRLELNEKDKIIETFKVANGTDACTNSKNESSLKATSQEIESLNKFLDQTVECIKGWPEELAGSSHVQNLMRSLLSAHKPPDQDELNARLQNMHL